MSDEYKTGFKNPPKKSQFKKGQSGNPKGRPKGKKSNYEVLLKYLEGKVTIRRDGQKQEIDRFKALIEKLYERAMNGTSRDRDIFLNFLNRAGLLSKQEVEPKHESGVLILPAAPETLEQWAAWASVQQAPYRGGTQSDSPSDDENADADKANEKPRKTGRKNEK